MRSSSNLNLLAFVAASFVVACTPGNENSVTGGSAPAGGANAGGSSSGGANQGGQEMPGGSTGTFDPTGGGTTQPGCDAQPNQDKDEDGFTINDGDCNDCDANVNPGAIEVIGNASGGDGGGGTGGAGTGGAGGAEYVPADEDCDGEADNVAAPDCDAGLQLASTDPLDAAKAIELCKVAEGDTDWGVLDAQFVNANGGTVAANVQVGILASFGTNVPPQQGASLLALSSGTARLPGQPGACTSNSCGAQTATLAPPGFPQAAPNCPIDSEIFNDIGLEVTLRAPTNATGYTFDFKFTSFEFGEYVCTNFNDQFIALVNPPPMGAQDGNISFDAAGNPVSVNIAFFDVCNSCADFAQNCFDNPPMVVCPTAPAGCCSAGGAQLVGTGFDNGFGATFPEDAGGTSWLRTAAPVEGG
ncbi:MAG: choice-of-anchor L domain-containing protein, partial [Myxococcales bacterium]|nr:choice-of-anchor L domain-containing protein [Myxococcales bacterium]